MPLPLVPLAALTAGTLLGNNWLNRTALESPDFIPRLGKMKSDARYWGVGAGVLGLLMGPAFPILGALGVGAGLASLTNWNTMGHVQKAVETFTASQAMQPTPMPWALPGGAAQIPQFIAPFFQGETAPQLHEATPAPMPV